ncbi:choice-of-anchor A family protein [Micromonospora arborensis]|uniref:choice-of-anchor A family protein n=1 Tax=Micromonospora arborensis TaxID=2116518 RepID=UPI00340E80D0
MRISLWAGRQSRAAALVALGGVLAVNGLPALAPAARRPANQALAAAGAAIGTIDPLAPAQSFGVMTEGNANLGGGRNEGSLAAGGDLTFGSYTTAGATAGSFVVPGDDNPTALVVGGRVNFSGSVDGSHLRVLSSGYAKIGNATGTFVRNTDNNGAPTNTRILPADDPNASPRVDLDTRQPVGSVAPTAPINFSAAFASFRRTTASLATCDSTVTLRTASGTAMPRPIPAGSDAVVTLTPGRTNVLNLSATELNNIRSLTFAIQPNANTPLLVNVDTHGIDDAFAWTAPSVIGIGRTQARYVLFNFPTATAITLTASAATVEGTIYAPNADLIDVSATNTDGGVITRTLDHQGGAIHYVAFSTTLSCGGGGPASIALIMSSTTTTISSIGQQVPYTFDVVNTGGIALSGITVAATQSPPSSNANLGPITCADTALAPGARTTCSATYTATRADLDNDAVTNTATARGTAPGASPVLSDPDSLTIPARRLAAAVTVVKSSTTPSIDLVGQQVPYRYLIANTGEATLTNVAITDVPQAPSSTANLGPIACPQTTLPPGQAITCTATYTVTRADLDNHGITGTATARGTPHGTTTAVTSPPSTLTIPEPGLTAALTVTSSSTTTALNTVGQKVPYSFQVVNNGGLTLTGVRVTTTQTPPSSNVNLGPIACDDITLLPGEQTICTATYTVTQTDLDNNGVTTTATAHGTGPGGGRPIDSRPATLTIPETGLVASIALVATSTTTAITTVGQRVEISFVVANTGGFTLTDITVTDVEAPPAPSTNLGPITCTRTTLLPSAVTRCTATHTVTQSDLDAGSISSSAIAQGNPADGAPPVLSPPSTLTITDSVRPPAIVLVKQALSTTFSSVGQLADYGFMVVNTGGIRVYGIRITDVQAPPSSNANLGRIECPEFIDSIAPGETLYCRAAYRVTQADLDNDEVTNTATARAYRADTNTSVDSLPSTATTRAADLTPAITVVKSSTTTTITSVGQQVPYRYLVTNTGRVPLQQMYVSESTVTVAPIDCPKTTLDPGETTTCTATHTVTQTDLNNNGITGSATARSVVPIGSRQVNSLPVSLTTPKSKLAPAITVIKTAGTTAITTVGQQVPYRFQVVNTGGLTLTNVTVTDVQTPPSSNANLGAINCPATPLAPGAITVCTATYTVSQADLDNNAVTDTATAHGTVTGGDSVVNSPPSTLTISRVEILADIDVIKSSTAATVDVQGQQVAYTFLVVNTGGFPLTDVTVNDTVLPPAERNGLGPITCLPQNIPNGHATLAPGASIECRTTYLVTMTDLAGAALRNVATATGTPPVGPPRVSPPSALNITIASNDPTPHPAIAITSRVSPTTVSAAGDVITYEFVVSNTGTTPLNAVTVSETEFSGTGTPGTITCGTPSAAIGTVILPSGASTTCTSTYTVTAADIESSRITRTAVAAGTPPTLPGQDPSTPIRSEPATATVTTRVQGNLPVTGESYPRGSLGAGVLAILLGALLLQVTRQRRMHA